LSWVMEYNIIAGGPVGAADVEAVFGRWGRVCALGGGAVDVVIGDCGFVIAPEASLSVNPAFVRWVAHARGFGGSARVYSTEIDESYLESEGEEVWEAWATRRNQLVDMRAAEKNRLHQVHETQVESVKQLIAHFDRLIDELDKQIDDHTHTHFDGKAQVAEQIKGIGSITAA